MPTGSEAFLELPIALGYGPATGPTLKTALCHIRTLVGRRINTAHWNAPSELPASVLLCPVVGRSRPAVVACCTVRSGVFHHWIHHLWPQGAVPQALTLFGGVGFIARRLRRPEKGNADGVRGIFGTVYRVGLRPCDRTHLKNGLVPYSYVGGT